MADYSPMKGWFAFTDKFSLRTFFLTALRSLVVAGAISLCSCHQQARDPENVLNEAQADAQAGRYKQALEKQIWFHEHALEKEPALYGVRLSFALQQWLELGKKYPKALDELKKIRDDDASLLLAGKDDADLFSDVEAINSNVGEPEATVRLFKEIDKMRPAFAASVSYRAEGALVGAGEYSLARKYLGDPEKRFVWLAQRYKEGVEHAAARSGRDREMSQHAFEGIFTKRIVCLIVILDKTSDHQDALKLQAQALKVLDNHTIRGCIQAP